MLRFFFKANFPLEKEGALYQIRVNLSRTFTQTVGGQAHAKKCTKLSRLSLLRV